MDKVDRIIEITDRYLECFGKILTGFYYLPPELPFPAAIFDHDRLQKRFFCFPERSIAPAAPAGAEKNCGIPVPERRVFLVDF